MDNFPVNHIPAHVAVASYELASAFRNIDQLRPLLTTDEAKAVLTQLELLVEKMAGV